MFAKNLGNPKPKQSKFCLYASLLIVLLFLVVSDALGAEIKNPYHKVPRWKLWSLDAAPVSLPDNKTIAPPPVNKRIYPDDVDTEKYPGRFLAYRGRDWPQRKYAGFWYDVYSSRDKGHSRIRPFCEGEYENSAKIYNSIIHLQGGPLHSAGVNFTSQSTTGMGHDITNTEKSMSILEKYFYFADILTAGPAHISFRDYAVSGATDKYHSLVPILFNSVGSSGSETMALTKMIIAGGYLPRELKPELKLNGIYPSSLLYIWKAGLPYQVPYANELRHRVAYKSQGDQTDVRGNRYTRLSYYYNNYNDTSHLRNMVNLAKSMSVAPPVALLKTIEIDGGETIYSLKTTLLVHQKIYRAVTLRISTEDCYDLQGLPLTFRWKVLYGNKDTSIEKEENSSIYKIIVPSDRKLPEGRTSILLIANNGKFDSNPAIVNVYRPDGVNNLRPSLAGLEDQIILPGERVGFDITGIDPEGFPVTLYQWAGEVGCLDGNTFTWDCPADQADDTKSITIIASDGTCGNSYNSKQIKIHVCSVIASASADKLEGEAPLKVNFSSAGSRDKRGGIMNYLWEFDDGTTSRKQNPVHIFAKPGFYQVTLTVKGPSGSDSAELIVFIRPFWPLAINNGWNFNKIDNRVWQKQSLEALFKIHDSFLRIYSKEMKGGFNLTSVRDFSPPLYLEAVYQRSSYLSKGGSGFQVFGAQIGYPADPEASGKMISIGRSIKDDKSKWITKIIGQKIRQTKCRTLLRLFVDNDPNNPGKIRYAGYLHTEAGPRFFRFDNQELVDNKIAVLSASVNARFDIHRFQVLAPRENLKGAGSTLKPFRLSARNLDENICSPPEIKEPPKKLITFKKINVEGNGLNIKNGSSIPNPTSHTDFGSVVVKGGSVIRSFTIQNPGHRELKLTDPVPYVIVCGDNSTDFTVLKNPKPIISKHGSTVFSIRFQPRAKGLKTAKIIIPYRSKMKGKYLFHIKGRGISFGKQ